MRKAAMAATLEATPSLVPAGVEPGTTTITWNTADGSVGKVYVSVNGGPKQLFASGARGSRDAPWISAGATYEFSLCAGDENTTQLSTVSVMRDAMFRRLNDYKQAIAHHFPALPKHYIESWSIGGGDARVLKSFLEYYPRKEVTVLDIGTFVGVSAFHFASQTKVQRVLSIDRNPSLAKMHEWGVIADGYDHVRNLKLLDVVERTLAEFNYEQQKIQLREGSLAGSEKAELLAAIESTESTPLIAFVDGDHSKEGVRADLEAIFESNPNAVAILHDCSDHSPAAPSVRAAISDFLGSATRKHYFRPLDDLAVGVEKINLGIVYPDSGALEMEQLFLELRQTQ